MPDHLPSHGARVARPRSEVIPEGDGVPSTHTHHTATRHRKVTTDPGSRAPLPFAARRPRVPWAGVALISLACAVMAALPTWVITGDPTITIGMASLLVAWCLTFVALALAGYGNPVDRQLRRQRRHGFEQADEDDDTAADMAHFDVARLRAQLVELEERGCRR